MVEEAVTESSRVGVAKLLFFYLLLRASRMIVFVYRAIFLPRGREKLK